jgi:hypothetical protein
LNGTAQLGRETQPIFRAVAPDELLERGLVDEDLAGLGRLDLRSIPVDAGYVGLVLGACLAENRSNVICVPTTAMRIFTIRYCV